MKNSLVWEILSDLNRKELRAFTQFLSSPYFNSRQDLIDLTQLLTESLLSQKTPEKTILYRNLFPHQPFDDQKWRLTLSRLQKKLEKFLVINELENRKNVTDEILITILRKRKMDRNFNKSLKRIQTNIDKYPLRNPDFYFHRFELEYQQYHYLSETGRYKTLNLEEVESNLDIAYISTKLRQHCFTLSHQTVFNIPYESVLMDQIIELANDEPYKSIPPISLYSRFITLFKTGDIKAFQRFKEILFKQKDHYTQEEFRDIFLLSLNFCIRKINENIEPFFKETLEIYKKGLELELLLENGKLSRFTYNNIVAIALKIDDRVWVEDFIHSYRDFLDTPHQHAAFSLNMARLAFLKANFMDALLYLQKADHEDLISHMTAKILQLKIYYELKETDSLDSLLLALRVFIRRKKRVGYHYQIWKNILTYIQKINKVNPFDKTAIGKLEQKIMEEPILPERDWLLEKLGDLKIRA